MGSSQAAAIWYVPQMTEDGQGTLTLTNLNATPVQVSLVLYRGTGGPLLKRYMLAAHQSQAIRSANLVAVQQGVGLAVTAGSPVVVEYYS